MYTRRYYRSRGQRYSSETVVFNSAQTGNAPAGANFPVWQDADHHNHTGLVVIPATNVMGSRKCKNFTIKVLVDNNESPIMGALVYVPEGTEPSKLEAQGSNMSISEPNQNVISTFIIPPVCTRDSLGAVDQRYAACQPIRVSSRLSRNLSSGDRIVLLFANVAAENVQSNPIVVTGTINFAIKY